jgi:hypothetical protein
LGSELKIRTGVEIENEMIGIILKSDRREGQERTGENFVMKSSTVLIPRHILLAGSNYG